MTIALVQHTTYILSNGTASGSVALPGAVTAGNAIIVAQADGHGASDVPTLSDNLNGSWGAAKQSVALTVDGDNNLVWIFPNTAGGTLTLTSTIGGSGTVQFHISEWSGLATSSPYDNSATNYSANAASLSASLTPGQANELLFALVGTDSNEPTPTIGGGFTALDSTQNLATAYQIVSSVASYTPSFTFINGNCECGVIVAGFKDAGGAGAPTLSQVERGQSSFRGMFRGMR